MHTLKAVELKKNIKDLNIVKGISLEVKSGEVV
ncbi:MAG: ABC transporter ATP-binding protein, partial [Sulfurimonas sp.]